MHPRAYIHPSLLLPPQLVPALSKWGGATVGLTLIAIGCMGIYETFFEQHHDDEEHGHGGPTASGEQEAAGGAGRAGRKVWGGGGPHQGARRGACAARAERGGGRLLALGGLRVRRRTHALTGTFENEQRGQAAALLGRLCSIAA